MPGKKVNISVSNATTSSRRCNPLSSKNVNLEHDKAAGSNTMNAKEMKSNEKSLSPLERKRGKKINNYVSSAKNIVSDNNRHVSGNCNSGRKDAEISRNLNINSKINDKKDPHNSGEQLSNDCRNYTPKNNNVNPKKFKDENAKLNNESDMISLYNDIKTKYEIATEEFEQYIDWKQLFKHIIEEENVDETTLIFYYDTKDMSMSKYNAIKKAKLKRIISSVFASVKGEDNYRNKEQNMTHDAVDILHKYAETYITSIFEEAAETMKIDDKLDEMQFSSIIENRRRDQLKQYQPFKNFLQYFDPSDFTGNKN